jgi:hypothetical protein
MSADEKANAVRAMPGSTKIVSIPNEATSGAKDS